MALLALLGLTELREDKAKGSQRKQLLSFALFRARNRAMHCAGAELGFSDFAQTKGNL